MLGFGTCNSVSCSFVFVAFSSAKDLRQKKEYVVSFLQPIYSFYSASSLSLFISVGFFSSFFCIYQAVGKKRRFSLEDEKTVPVSHARFRTVVDFMTATIHFSCVSMVVTLLSSPTCFLRWLGDEEIFLLCRILTLLFLPLSLTFDLTHRSSAERACQQFSSLCSRSRETLASSPWFVIGLSTQSCVVCCS